MTEPSTTLPAGLRPYKRSPIFTEETIPEPLRGRHSTKPGVWGVIRVIEGRLRYRVLAPPAERILDPDHPGIAAPAQPHEVEPLGSVRFFIEFHARVAAGSIDDR